MHKLMKELKQQIDDIIDVELLDLEDGSREYKVEGLGGITVTVTAEVLDVHGGFESPREWNTAYELRADFDEVDPELDYDTYNEMCDYINSIFEIRTVWS